MFPLETHELSFITLTGPTTDTKAISKHVRRHVMQDYVRKAKSKNSATVFTVTPTPQLEKPANHKGKFKLDSWKRRNSHISVASEDVVQQESTTLDNTSTRMLVRQKSNHEAVLSSRLFKETLSFSVQSDPFDTLAIAPSDKLIWYCKSSQYLSPYL
jgi:hypothetical protein